MSSPRPIDRINESSIDVESSRIYLQHIDGDTGTWFSQVVDYMNRPCMDSRPIRVTLMSPGGDVVSMFAIHDAIRSSRRPIEVLGLGEVSSAGVLILASGHDRVASESCCLMMHEFYGGDGDLGFKASKDRRKYNDFIMAHWCELMGRYTREKDAAWWRRTLDRKGEYWLLGGREIVAAGLADRVLEEPSR